MRQVAKPPSMEATSISAAPPLSEALDARLLRAATRLFTRAGYAGVSMDDIAAEAGAGKQSIYRRYRTKEELFRAAISTCYLAPLGALWDSEVVELRAMETAGESPLTVLRVMCRRVLEFTRRPDVLSLYRLLVAEGGRFPDWTTVVTQGTDSWERMVFDQLHLARDAGEIPDAPLKQTHRALVGLLTGWVLQQDIAARHTLDDHEVDEFFNCAWSIFLHGICNQKP